MAFLSISIPNEESDEEDKAYEILEKMVNEVFHTLYPNEDIDDYYDIFEISEMLEPLESIKNLEKFKLTVESELKKLK